MTTMLNSEENCEFLRRINSQTVNSNLCDDFGDDAMTTPGDVRRTSTEQIAQFSTELDHTA